MDDISSRLKLYQYQSQIKAIMADSDALDSKVQNEVRQLIEEMREKILLRITEVQGRIAAVGGVEPAWGPFWVSRLVSDFNQIIIMVSQKFRKNLGGYTIKAYEIGRGMADKGLEFALPGVDLSDPELVKVLPNLDIDGVKLAASFPGDLITNMEEKQLAAVTKKVSLAVSLGKSPGELIADLSGSINQGPWLETKYRAEVIARTETARVQELGRQSRDKQIRRAFPGMQLYQQWLTYPIRQWPCKKCAQYDGNVYDGDGRLYIKAPGKSAEIDIPYLPLHPNCRCSLIPWAPGVSKNPITPEEKTAEERKEQLLKKAQANVSKLSWDDDLKIWIIQLPDGSRRTMNIGKRASDEELQTQALKLVRSAGYQKVHNVVLIEHPRAMIGPSYDRKMRAMNKSFGT